MDAGLRKLFNAAERRVGVVTTGDAAECGISRDRLRHLVASGLLVRLHRGVYRVTSSPDTLSLRAFAACRACGDDATASHRTAGGLWKCISEPDVVDVTVPGHRRSAKEGIVVHRRTLHKRDVTELGVIPITTPARTLVDLAGVLTVDALEEALDVALRERLVTPERVLASCDRAAANTRGVGLLTELVKDRAAYGVPGSKLERIALRLIRSAGLPQPQRQYRLRVDGRNFDIDLAYPEQRIAVELEGQKAHWDRWQSDHDRHYLVEIARWRPIYFTWDDATLRPLKFVLHVAEALGLWPMRWRTTGSATATRAEVAGCPVWRP